MTIRIEDFIKVPEGDYSIGINGDAIEAILEKLKSAPIKKEFLFSSYPRQSVHLGTIWISRFLTTCRAFSEFAEAADYTTEAEREGWGWIWLDGRWRKKDGVSWKMPFGISDADRLAAEGIMPVMQLSWNDAAAYCAWLSESSGLPIRLPRELEWEVFAGICGFPGVSEAAIADRIKSTGPEFLDALRTAAREGSTHSTGLLWEWTENWYDRYPGGPDGRDYGTVYKVLRGGSVLSEPVQRTREFRLRKCPTARSPYYGFRIAVDFSEKGS
ncbi:MAG: SUMF1/EgtB/PvdO family nonheme iron enzyme [Spirochaetes bacterium]|nr:SUMF1/EgtB/PvdO family nonheme iron enzyme [Spirochaetota bacterium]